MMAAEGRILGPAIIAATAAADQASKAFVRASADLLEGGLTVVPGFDLVLHQNEGIAFGLLRDLPWWVLVLLAGIIVALLASAMLRSDSRIEIAAYGAIIGGAIGNVIDRVRIGGVTDFLDLYVGTAHWPAFNLADVFVVSGVAVLLFQASWGRQGDDHPT